MSGDTEGLVTIWDTAQPPSSDPRPLLQPALQFQALKDCVNGIRYGSGWVWIMSVIVDHEYECHWGQENHVPPPFREGVLGLALL